MLRHRWGVHRRELTAAAGAALGLLICGSAARATVMPSSGAAISASAAVAPTRLINTRPVTATYQPSAGLKITTAGKPATCSAGSDSVGNAYRCFSGNDIYDPCWADETPGQSPSVLCQDAPWQKSVVRLKVKDGLSPFLTAPPRRQIGSPWGVQLSDGKLCLALQGAHGSAFGKIVEYGCEHSPLTLLGTMTITHGVGRFQSAAYDQSTNSYAHGPAMTVRIAWYAIPDDSDQLASQQDRCTAPALAYSAQTQLTLHQRISDGASITRYACAGGYALAQNSTYEDETQLLFASTERGWAQIASANIIQAGPSTVPARTLATLTARLRVAGQEHISY
jgi:hypothetical protein